MRKLLFITLLVNASSPGARRGDRASFGEDPAGVVALALESFSDDRSARADGVPRAPRSWFLAGLDGDGTFELARRPLTEAPGGRELPLPGGDDSTSSLPVGPRRQDADFRCVVVTGPGASRLRACSSVGPAGAECRRLLDRGDVVVVRTSSGKRMTRLREDDPLRSFPRAGRRAPVRSSRTRRTVSFAIAAVGPPRTRGRGAEHGPRGTPRWCKRPPHGDERGFTAVRCSPRRAGSTTPGLSVPGDPVPGDSWPADPSTLRCCGPCVTARRIFGAPGSAAAGSWTSSHVEARSRVHVAGWSSC